MVLHVKESQGVGYAVCALDNQICGVLPLRLLVHVEEFWMTAQARDVVERFNNLVHDIIDTLVDSLSVQFTEEGALFFQHIF